jgi:hypothetical protein
MLAAVGIVFLRVEFEPHVRRYVNYIVRSSSDEKADHTVLFDRRPCRAESAPWAQSLHWACQRDDLIRPTAVPANPDMARAGSWGGIV